MSAPSVLPRARMPVAGLVRSVGARVPPPSVARLRAAVTALFVLDGAVFGSWAARVPDVAAAVGAGHSTLGVALLCLSLGALVCMRVTGALVRPVRRRAGERRRRGRRLGGRACCPGSSTRCPALCVALFVFGAATGMVNVAANAVGVQVEARVGRPILSGLHAGFSLGGLARRARRRRRVLGARRRAAPGARRGRRPVRERWALPAARSAPAAAPRPPAPSDGVRRADPPAHRRARRARRDRRLHRLRRGRADRLGCAAAARAPGRAAPRVAAAGYAGFSLAMAGGRLAGGRLLQRDGGAAAARRRCGAGRGRRRRRGDDVVPRGRPRPGSCSSASGLANVFPLAIGRAGLLGGARGIALATTVGYTGLLGGPPVIGLLAESAGLPVALGSVAVMALAAAVLVLTVSGERVRMPRPRTLLDKAVGDGRRPAPAGGVRLRARHRRLRPRPADAHAGRRRPLMAEGPERREGEGPAGDPPLRSVVSGPLGSPRSGFAAGASSPTWRSTETARGEPVWWWASSMSCAASVEHPATALRGRNRRTTRPEQDQRDDAVDDDRHRLEQPADVAVADLQRLAQLLLRERAEDHADDRRAAPAGRSGAS